MKGWLGVMTLNVTIHLYLHPNKLRFLENKFFLL